jgi:hypothetical protein
MKPLTRFRAGNDNTVSIDRYALTGKNLRIEPLPDRAYMSIEKSAEENNYAVWRYISIEKSDKEKNYAVWRYISIVGCRLE